MLFKLWSFLFRKEIIVLQDTWGEEYLTWKRKGAFGNYAHVFPISKVGHVVLHEDGTCSGQSTHIKQWKVAQ